MNELAQAAQQRAAAARYDDASEARDDIARRRREHGSQVADSEDQIEARFGRLLKTGQVPPEAIDAAVASPEPVERHVLLERIIGATKDLQPVKFLASGARAVRSIARISMSNHGALAPRGTGFLVSPRLLLTNNHVLGDPGEAARAVVEFNYEIAVDDRPAVVATYLLDPGTLFLTDPELDYTLVGVRADANGNAPGATFGWNRLVSEQGKVVNGEAINVVGHPMGRLKEIAIRNGVLQYQHEHFLHYTTDTEQGSSGSPVFNDQWEVVALHHASIPQPATSGAANGNGHGARADRPDGYVNEGTRVSVLVRHAVRQRMSDEQRVLLDELSRPADAASGLSLGLTNADGHDGGTNGHTGAVQPRTVERAVVMPHAETGPHDRFTANGGGDVVWVYGFVPVPLPGQP